LNGWELHSASFLSSAQSLPFIMYSSNTMTQTSKIEIEKTTDWMEDFTQNLIDSFEAVSGETLWKDSQVAIGFLIENLIIQAKIESDPLEFMNQIATKFKTEFVDK
jgi:hypothetical protein